jgi:hypothetical protein
LTFPFLFGECEVSRKNTLSGAAVNDSASVDGVDAVDGNRLGVQPGVSVHRQQERAVALVVVGVDAVVDDHQIAVERRRPGQP